MSCAQNIRQQVDPHKTLSFEGESRPSIHNSVDGRRWIGELHHPDRQVCREQMYHGDQTSNLKSSLS